MVISVSPMRCVPMARWLSVGSRSSIACPPFLNCARAAPANPPSASASPAHEMNNLFIHTLLFDWEPLLPVAIPHTAVGIDGWPPLLVSSFFPAPATERSPLNKESLRIPHNRVTRGAGLFNIDIHLEVSELQLESLRVVQVLYIAV